MSQKIGNVSSAIGMVASILSTALPYWLFISSDSGHIYAGLWEQCVSSGGLVVCVTVEYQKALPDWMHACQALMILGMMSFAFDICIAIYAFVRKSPISISGVLSIFGGVCCIVAVIVFASEYANGSSEIVKLHAGFALAVVAGVCGLVGGGLMLIGRCTHGGYSSFE